MPEMYEIHAKVISQKGTCGAGHKVGDEWVIGYKTPDGICLSAFDSMFSDLMVFIFGGAFPWSSDPDTARVTCPDAGNPVVFELKRVR
ncbi:MAG: TIGR04076 family protein [Dehalococcoidales bacterium]|nr:MAG: TIGR04076 family protein [Dehalococcoidales bacterium]